MVEVVVAIALIGVGLSTTIGALTKFNAFASESRNATGAYAAAMNQIDAIQSATPFNPPGQIPSVLTGRNPCRRRRVTIYEDANSNTIVAGTRTTTVADVSAGGVTHLPRDCDGQLYLSWAALFVLNADTSRIRLMKPGSHARSGLTIVELMVTTVLIGVLGLVIFSILNTGTILGAKNTAVNTAHQEARIAMLQMTKNLHSAISPLVLYDPSNSKYAGASRRFGSRNPVSTLGRRPFSDRGGCECGPEDGQDQRDGRGEA